MVLWVLDMATAMAGLRDNGECSDKSDRELGEHSV